MNIFSHQPLFFIPWAVFGMVNRDKWVHIQGINEPTKLLNTIAAIFYGCFYHHCWIIHTSTISAIELLGIFPFIEELISLLQLTIIVIHPSHLRWSPMPSHLRWSPKELIGIIVILWSAFKIRMNSAHTKWETYFHVCSAFKIRMNSSVNIHVTHELTIDARLIWLIHMSISISSFDWELNSECYFSLGNCEFLQGFCTLIVLFPYLLCLIKRHQIEHTLALQMSLSNWNLEIVIPFSFSPFGAFYAPYHTLSNVGNS